eukprot:6872372-Pyramimonas_sp.AAC.1
MGSHVPEEAEGSALLAAVMQGLLENLYAMRNDHITDAALSEAAAALCAGQRPPPPRTLNTRWSGDAW